MARESDLLPGTTTVRDPPVNLDPGTIIDGRYRLIEIIGEGGMGQVFEAEHLELRRKVAIKTLFTKEGVDPALAQRFEREAHTLAAVAHPNIVTITDYGVHRDLPFLVMERLEGQSLATLLDERGPLDVEHAAALMRQILAGLAHAHARGLVHRDLKPGNVWVEMHEDGEHVKLLDFGFAKFVEAEGGPLLTAVGVVVGTLSYMSPEQASGGAIDHRSDLYSAGVLFYQMVTGRRPFEGEPIELLRAHLTEDAPSLREARPDGHFSSELEAVVRRALEKKPEKRFESGAELAKALQAATAGGRPASADRAAPPEDVDEDAKTIVWAEGEARARPAEAGPQAALASRDAPEPREEGLEGLIPRAPAKKGPTWSDDPERRRALVIAALVTALVLGGSFIVLRLAPWPLGADEAQEPSGAELAAAAAEAAVAEGSPPPSADPWSLWPREPRLERYRVAVERGGQISREAVKTLRTYGREHPDDPRVELVIARSFLNARWFSDALEMYASAYVKDRRIAASEEFLSGLVQLARYEATSERASEIVRAMDRARAARAVEQALAELGDDPASKARLEALLRALEG